MGRRLVTALSLGALILPAAAGAATRVVNMGPPKEYADELLGYESGGKWFYEYIIDVHQGDSVKFVNDDPFANNVFSLSDVKSFDLGSYGQGLAKSVVMDKPGTVEVECAVHPDMKLMIEVTK